MIIILFYLAIGNASLRLLINYYDILQIAIQERSDKIRNYLLRNNDIQCRIRNDVK